MAKDFDNQFRSRSGQRAKRRKTNLILNSLIIIVILLIIIVASSIFLGGGKEDKKDTASGNKQEQTASNKNEQGENKTNVSEGSNQDTNAEADDNVDDEDKDDESDQSTDEDDDVGLESEETIAEESTEANVKKSYTNPNWESVGTEQTNGHQYSTDSNSTDWKEKEEALSYATGISQDNMTVWFLERGNSDSEAIGTITPKDQSKAYRVYLSWVDGQGWKPTKVEELKENDKK